MSTRLIQDLQNELAVFEGMYGCIDTSMLREHSSTQFGCILEGCSVCNGYKCTIAD